MTSDVSADVLLRGQLGYLREQGLRVSLVCGRGDRAVEVAAREGVEHHPVDMQRELSPRADLHALVQLCRVLARLRPDVVNASTPKAALLGLCAAWACRVPRRIYVLRGLRLETLSPAGQLAMSATERLCAWLSDEVICVSESLKRAVVSRGLAPPHKCRVLLGGSSNGIDCARFSRSDDNAARAGEIARELGLDRRRPTLGFVGRGVRDKGIAELSQALCIVRAEHPEAQLLVVGAGFAGDDECPEMRELRGQPGVFVVGSVSDVVPYYRLMDVLAFPSHREGFPNVVLEASCMGLPVVGFDVTGVRDAIVDRETGTICEPRNSRALAEALGRYLSDPELSERHGRAGAARARRDFARERVWQAVRELYG